MEKVEKIAREVEELSAQELAKFRKWFAIFDAEAWDRQIEADVKAGNLDALGDRVLHDHAAGKSTKL
jgi:hypothetical protein